MAVDEFTNSARPRQTGSGPLSALPAGDRELALTVATLLLDVVDLFGKYVTTFVNEQVKNLPQDAEAVAKLEAHGEANAFEVLTTLRAEIPPEAYAAPMEAISHARYLRSRGVGYQSLVEIYRQGFGVLREVIIGEIENRSQDAGQIQRVTNVFDAYGFPFVEKTLQRLSYEFGATDVGWSPDRADDEFDSTAIKAAAIKLREDSIAQGTWIAKTVDQSRAKERGQAAIDEFAKRFEDGVRKYGLGERLAQAKTSITLTLADEPGESIALMLDRAPVEIVDGETNTESQMWITSTDLPRLWSPDYYLPMAIAAGRVRTAGPARNFLRVLPIIRSVGGLIPDRYNPNIQGE